MAYFHKHKHKGMHIKAIPKNRLWAFLRLAYPSQWSVPFYLQIDYSPSVNDDWREFAVFRGENEQTRERVVQVHAENNTGVISRILIDDGVKQFDKELAYTLHFPRTNQNFPLVYSKPLDSNFWPGLLFGVFGSLTTAGILALIALLARLLGH
jgi:hypothetical protein